MRCQRCLVAAIALVLSACAPPISRPPDTAALRPEGFPEPYYQQAIERHQPVFLVDPARSILVIEVRRAGALARLGHDHVVASHDVRGYVAPASGRSDLYVQLDRLAVDEPELRAQAGFDTQPDVDDIAATRRNMLAKVLDADRYPFALINVTRADPVENGTTTMRVAITLHGAARAYDVPAEIKTDADEVNISGRLVFNQSDFGIVPLSILGGAIQVQDELNLRFNVWARRVGS